MFEPATVHMVIWSMEVYPKYTFEISTIELSDKKMQHPVYQSLFLLLYVNETKWTHFQY